MKSILITGCSSGFGLATARLFLDRGWAVIATMRTPDATVLPRSDRLRILQLDVTDRHSIAEAVAAAGPIDVLVNNAGIGLMNALEGTPMDTVRQIFETNTFGTMAMVQAVLPQFRARRSGMVVNVTSSVTLKPLHLLSVYTASKAAVNAFSTSLALELAAFDISVRLVIPGRSPETPFGANARARGGPPMPEAYAAVAAQAAAGWAQASQDITRAQDVADAVWRAVTDPSCPMQLPAGVDAIAAAGSAG